MSGSEASVLVVEDDPTIRALLAMALSGAGYADVREAARGDEGLAEAKRRAPDLVLLDVMLPGLDGFAFARAVRAAPALAATRIIMITARTQPEDIVRGLEAGADDYVVKPFDRKILLARVKAVLRRGLPVTEGRDFDGLRIDERRALAHRDAARQGARPHRRRVLAPHAARRAPRTRLRPPAGRAHRRRAGRQPPAQARALG